MVKKGPDKLFNILIDTLTENQYQKHGKKDRLHIYTKREIRSNKINITNMNPKNKIASVQADQPFIVYFVCPR